MKMHPDDQTSLTDEHDDTNGNVNLAFVRAWYKDKALLNDAQIVEFFYASNDQSKYFPNFERLLLRHNLSLNDVPPDVDWIRYSRQHPGLSAGPSSEYHIIFHYLNERRRSKSFNMGFYRAYYGISDLIADREVIATWSTDAEENKRFSSFAELLSYHGLDNIFTDEVTFLKELSHSAEWRQHKDWEQLVTALKMLPVRVLNLTESGERNTEIYNNLHRNFIEMGLFRKASKLHALTRELGLNTATDSATLNDTEGLSIFRHTKIDPDFYFNWHSDLLICDKLFLQHHWYNFGFDEGRPPTFEHALQKLGLNIDKLPLDFDWREYTSHTAELKDSINVNFYTVAVHKLQNTKDEFTFDADFYTSLYEDAMHLKALPLKAELHWISKSSDGQRARCINELMEMFELPRLLFPTWLVIEEVRLLNPELTQSNLNILKAIFSVTPIQRLRLTESNRLNSSFYCKFGEYYESVGQRGRAEELYLLANEFAENDLALEHLGNIYLNAGLHRCASQYYSRAIINGGCSEWAYVNQARCLVAQSNIDEINTMYTRAYSHYPESVRYESSIQESISSIWSAAAKLSASLIEQNNRTDLISSVSKTTRLIYEITTTQITLGRRKSYRGRIDNSRVTIIGDFHLPQCKRYRIDQKIEQLEAAGFTARAVSWTEHLQAQQLLTFSDICIFYRCPALPEIVKLIATAKSLGKITIYEIDDLIFDPLYPQPITTYGGYVSKKEYNDLILGMALYRSAAMLCDYGIASTQPLSTELSKLVGTRKCFVHRNAIDKKSSMLRPHTSIDKKFVDIFYGSGTKAHNTDFITEALPAILRILREEPFARLTIVGYLQLPNEITDEYGDRILNAPLTTSFMGYSMYLSNADINIAVLKPDGINNCKSELKWFEAAVCGVPSVMSATQNYLDVIDDGMDGFVAHNPHDWYRILKMLVLDKEKRADVGNQARSRVLREYSVENMAKRATDIIGLIIQDHCQSGPEVSYRSHHHE
jgi:glycosyltransferase involved in cell wall biosynthesis